MRAKENLIICSAFIYAAFIPAISLAFEEGLRVAVAGTQEMQATEVRRKMIVHIGTYDIETTGFQSRLASDGGISPSLIYPKTCGKPTQAKGFSTMAHAYVNEVLSEEEAMISGVNTRTVEGKDCKPMSQEFREEIFKSTSDIIISAEAFSLLNEAAFRRLLNDFSADFDVHILVVRAISRHASALRFHRKRNNEMVPCQFASEECIGLLSRVFGQSRIHLVSYEGLKGAGINLMHFACKTFASDPSQCYSDKGEANDIQSAPTLSADHMAYSASMIFNRLAMASGCQGRMLPSSAAFVKSFVHVLEGTGVTKSCNKNLQEKDSSDSFRQAVLNGKLPANVYYFTDEYSGQVEANLESQVCEFEELSVFESPERFTVISEAVKHAACSNKSNKNALGRARKLGQTTNVKLEKLHSLFAGNAKPERPSDVAAANHIKIGTTGSHERRAKLRLRMLIH